MEKIKKLLSQIKKMGLYPHTKVLESACGPEVVIEGRKVLMFGSYNYLGLANHPEVKKKACEAVEKYGVASGGVRWLSGTMDVHQQMDRSLAEFTHYEEALTTGTGFGTNTGLIPAIINLLGFKVNIPFLSKGDIIFSDELNHASIIDGCRLSQAKIMIYKHCNINDLHSNLKKYKNHRKLIITDGVFSMDGDIAPLGKIVELAQKYKAITMVDDAHSVGVLGKGGGGTAEFFGVKVDVNMGTMSKGLGCSGGFVTGNKTLIDYLRIACRSYVFSDSVPPVIAASIITAIDVIKKNPQLRDQLKKNAEYFRENMKLSGFNTLNSTTQIVPWLIGSEKKAVEVYNLLFENGIFAPCVSWPTVPKGTARIRFNMMAIHTREQLDTLLKACRLIGHKLKV